MTRASTVRRASSPTSTTARSPRSARCTRSSASDGAVLDLMSSWVSHFLTAPEQLTALGMNAQELAANEQAAAWIVHDLNADPVLPVPRRELRPRDLLRVRRLSHPPDRGVPRSRARARPGGLFVCTFSNRLFPTKAIQGWLYTDNETHMRIVSEYFVRSAAFEEPVAQLRTSLEHPGDPLYAVWAAVR